MTIKERVNSLVALGRQMDDLMSPEWMTVLQKAEIENPWFTKNNIIKALTAIRDQYLNQKNLERMIEKYHLDDHIVTKKIGLVLAGNIPLVGFHDVMCCYLTGHHCQIKYSDKDTVLMSLRHPYAGHYKSQFKAIFFRSTEIKRLRCSYSNRKQ
ncbi:MAG: hypothetical protein IPP49_17130 [Saprospiraceae bacterium]|nr:hypothetical protein [Saprospiraceae bacterium]